MFAGHQHQQHPMGHHHQHHSQQQHQQQQQQLHHHLAPATAGSPSPGPPLGAQGQQQQMLSAEQYHVMALQYQLQQSQAQAQAQAQLLSLYQQQQQQQQLQSAASAYHQALAQAARSQAALPYGLQPHTLSNAPGSSLPQHPLLSHYQQQQPQQQQMQFGGYSSDNASAASSMHPQMPPSLPGMQMPPHLGGGGAMPNSSDPASTYGVPLAQSAAQGGGGSAAPNPSDARIHAGLAATCVEWVPLPPRYVMDSVAKTAAAAKLARRTATQGSSDSGESIDATKPAAVANGATKTVFVGGISYDVARDARVLPWLAASMCKGSVVVRKVIPHKERKPRTDATAGSGASAPKLALSAFVVVDGDDAEALVDALHHRVMWDIGGCWVARSPDAVDALRDYANAQCTWQRREQGAAAGLPRHMMTVEAATAMGSHDKHHQQPSANAKRARAMPTANFGANIDIGGGGGAFHHQQPPAATGPAQVHVGHLQAATPPPTATDSPSAARTRFDWGVLPTGSSVPPSPAVVQSPHTAAAAELAFVPVTFAPSARTPSARGSSPGSNGTIGDR